LENSICKSEDMRCCSTNMALVITIYIILHISLGLSWHLREEVCYTAATTISEMTQGHKDACSQPVSQPGNAKGLHTMLEP